jgi:hypothetical protein
MLRYNVGNTTPQSGMEETLAEDQVAALKRRVQELERENRKLKGAFCEEHTARLLRGRGYRKGFCLECEAASLAAKHQATLNAARSAVQELSVALGEPGPTPLSDRREGPRHVSPRFWESLSPEEKLAEAQMWISALDEEDVED